MRAISAKGNKGNDEPWHSCHALRPINLVPAPGHRPAGGHAGTGPGALCHDWCVPSEKTGPLNSHASWQGRCAPAVVDAGGAVEALEAVAAGVHHLHALHLPTILSVHARLIREPRAQHLHGGLCRQSCQVQTRLSTGAVIRHAPPCTASSAPQLVVTRKGRTGI
jgi:hypothetical protein